VAQFLQQLFLPEKGSLQSAVVTEWLQKCFSHQGLFHASLFGQLCRTRTIKALPAGRDSPELKFCHAVTVREVNKKFQNTSTACDDDNILAVLILAFNGQALTERPSKSPCQGPLKVLQALDIYGGALDTVPMHVEGLAKMVSLRGGIARIKLSGLAHLISQ
jgi:hypothetical protein